RVERLHDLDVEDRLAVLLAPALALPPRHPRGDRVDDVPAVADDVEVLVEVGRLLQQVEDGGELAHVVGPVRPPAPGPSVVVDVPAPAGWPGVAEGGSVGGGDDRHAGTPGGRRGRP